MKVKKNRGGLCFHGLALLSFKLNLFLFSFLGTLLIRSFFGLNLCRFSWREEVRDRTTLLAHVGVTILRQKSSHVSRTRHGADSLNVFCKKTDDCFEHGPDGPGRVPLFRMVLSDCETNFGVCFESSVLVHKDNVWGFEGVLIRQEDLPVVESFVKFSVLWSLEGKVPSVEVVGQGPCSEVGQLFVGKLFHFSEYSLVADVRWFHNPSAKIIILEQTKISLNQQQLQY